jgi:hypothetical protein
MTLEMALPFLRIMRLGAGPHLRILMRSWFDKPLNYSACVAFTAAEGGA